MSLELRKRIITSIILFVAAIFCILINKIIFIVVLFFISIRCFKEWCDINHKYFSKKHWNYFLIKCFGFIYLFIFFVSSIFLRGNSDSSAFFFIIILTICICSDIGGYVIGKSIGGKKLIKISPKKTISGSIGSLIFSFFPFLLLINFQNYLNISFSFSLDDILFCLFISLACQSGDLIISYFKRLNKIKDTGKILPGHGGMLDRIDGIIFAIPTAYVLRFILY